MFEFDLDDVLDILVRIAVAIFLTFGIMLLSIGVMKIVYKFFDDYSFSEFLR